jgi:hypothetical protein
VGAPTDQLGHGSGGGKDNFFIGLLLLLLLCCYLVLQICTSNY